MMVRLCVTAAALAACLSLCSAQSYVESPPAPPSGLFDSLRSLISRPSPAETIAMPDCLVTLTGGIDGVEKMLFDQLDENRHWVTLVTSKNDQISIAAVRNFYEAVRRLCGEEPASSDGEEGDAIEFEPRDVSDYRYAHLSFDNEPTMMWRWMVWKVPLIVFASPTTDPQQSHRLYDLRFWKISWTIPSVKTIVLSMPDKPWKELPVWDSTFAPGGQHDFVICYLSMGFSRVYTVLDRVPPWLLAVIGSFGGSMMLAYLHRGDSAQPRPKAE